MSVLFQHLFIVVDNNNTISTKLTNHWQDKANKLKDGTLLTDGDWHKEHYLNEAWEQVIEMLDDSIQAQELREKGYKFVIRELFEEDVWPDRKYRDMYSHNLIKVKSSDYEKIEKGKEMLSMIETHIKYYNKDDKSILLNYDDIEEIAKIVNQY